MKCPKCGRDTFVIRTMDKVSHTFRRRQCKNKNCRYRFNTKEMMSDEWNYKRIVKQIKDLLREV